MGGLISLMTDWRIIWYEDNLKNRIDSNMHYTERYRITRRSDTIRASER